MASVRGHEISPMSVHRSCMPRIRTSIHGRANANETRLVAFELIVDVSGNPNDAQRALPRENLRAIKHLDAESWTRDESRFLNSASSAKRNYQCNLNQDRNMNVNSAMQSCSQKKLGEKARPLQALVLKEERREFSRARFNPQHK